MPLLRLTAAQALVRYLCAQYVEIDGREVPYFAGVWGIFGHGNVAGLGEALFAERERLPTYRAHNEQSMAHAAIAFAKTMRRRRAMACTSSIGPGATNMVTACALAHVNRLPVLFLPGDVFAGRGPDPVLQQIELQQDPTVTANDCFRPVSAYFDRIMRPEQILDSLPRAISTMLDPADCGPATIAFCQDVQAEACEFPASFFEKKVWRARKTRPDRNEITALQAALQSSERPVIICGGGVHYSGAEETLDQFSEATGIPVVETQAGKGALPWDHENNLGAVGVTGTSAANKAMKDADLVIGIGTRLQDFTTGSRNLPQGGISRLVQVNVKSFDAHKHGALAIVGDAGEVIEELLAESDKLAGSSEWSTKARSWKEAWLRESGKATAWPQDDSLPSDSAIVGVVNENVSENSIVVSAAGGLPGELHKHWKATPGGYHVEYGYSCMGYEIAGGVGVKMAAPEKDVYVLVGDGSYLMANSEVATSILLGVKIAIVVLDNRGFGCINRLQQSTGNARFNNLLVDTVHDAIPEIDFAAHAESLGAISEKVNSPDALRKALTQAKSAPKTSVIVIETDPETSTEEGGHWWDVAVPEVSKRKEIQTARAAYETEIKKRQDGGK